MGDSREFEFRGRCLAVRGRGHAGAPRRGHPGASAIGVHGRREHHGAPRRGSLPRGRGQREEGQGQDRDRHRLAPVRGRRGVGGSRAMARDRFEFGLIGTAEEIAEYLTSVATGLRRGEVSLESGSARPPADAGRRGQARPEGGDHGATGKGQARDRMEAAEWRARRRPSGRGGPARAARLTRRARASQLPRWRTRSSRTCHLTHCVSCSTLAA